jgi:hypothetical protein
MADVTLMLVGTFANICLKEVEETAQSKGTFCLVPTVSLNSEEVKINLISQKI